MTVFPLQSSIPLSIYEYLVEECVALLSIYEYCRADELISSLVLLNSACYADVTFDRSVTTGHNVD